jgi:hypothetical protein
MITAGTRRVLVAVTLAILLTFGFFPRALWMVFVLYLALWFTLSLTAWIIAVRRPRPWWRWQYNDAVRRGYVK